jgi:predicted branched-subunit amino acid permease
MIVTATIVMATTVPDCAAEATYGAGVRAVLPLAAAVTVLGLAFGALAVSAGLTPAAATVMSATTFAGSAQFAAVGIFADGGAVGTALVSAALLNARYAAMGAATAPALQGRLWKRLLVAQLTVDETWAVAWLPGGRLSPERLVGAGLALLAAHVTSTALGAFAGAGLAVDAKSWGIDAAFPALFVVLLWPRLADAPGRRAAALGAAIALALTPVLPSGVPVAAAAAASLIGWRRR